MSGFVVTYSWSFVSRPPGSVATLANTSSLIPSFVADTTGTYVVELAVRAGDEVRADTTTIEVTATGTALAGSNIAYVYVPDFIERFVAVRANGGRAEVVKIDPMTGMQSVLDIGAFTPRSISVDPFAQSVAIGGLGNVALVTVNQFTLVSSQAAPGCTAAHVLTPFSARVDCFPADGQSEPISSVNMTTGEVTLIPSPVRFPDVATNDLGQVYMVDAASPQFYLLDGRSTPPLQEIAHGSLTGIAPPVIAAGTNQRFAVTGNGLAINPDASLRFDLQTPVSAGAFGVLRFEIAVITGSRLKIYSGTGPIVKLDVGVPSAATSVKLVAYSEDEHRLFLVAGTATGDVIYVVPR
jgi:hypothetical protein